MSQFAVGPDRLTQAPQVAGDSCIDTPAPRWKAVAGDDLCWRHWGEASYVFDARSGQTHFLNALAVEILQVLGEAPKTADEACRILLDRYGADDDEDFRVAVATSLSVMDNLGLVDSLRS